MRIVERDEIGKREHCCVRERGEVIGNLRPEFVKQGGELVVAVILNGAAICMDNRRSETRHYIERVIGEGDRLFVPRNAAAVERVIIEKAIVATDAFALQRAALKKWRIISLRRLHDAQKNRDVGHRTSDWPS